ncbi:CRISPR system Cascade subunit CasC [Methylobacterium crusticola]|uniref:CRISPR system Cascade subunit CasC n=1 Tax=Methylobacterium crusticola TaxID=1697972 RepID=A0ABQ4R816_9HYPH|nr:type I-E CRISPR-associated protein Cas7/Cse4/CasC [Methylobacterium crusticola]GJD53522.1 CRISPR system Cascade subunit CasC [Methylobacterium crusticola]
MTTPRFIQVHFLASYPGVLLNRDDAGLAKRLPFGGATRTRISSQCLKRHWRMAEDPRGLHRLAEEVGLEAERSKLAIEHEVTDPLRGQADEVVLTAVEKVFVEQVYGGKAADKKSRQALLLGRPELAYLAENAARIVRDAKNAKAAEAAAQAFFKEGDGKTNLKQLREQNHLAPGLESALFGRMVTSDIRANTDAAIHVAHAFTVHDEQPELDYFTVVDDLAKREDAGAAGVFDTELTSGLYYGYVVVDVPLLVSNLTGCPRKAWAGLDPEARDLAARVVENLIHLVATVSPGAKRGSTAPYTYADLVLVEAGERQPRTLANAFRDPVQPLRDRRALEAGATLAGETARAIVREIDGLDGMFGPHETRLQAARGPARLSGIEGLTLPDLATRAGAMVRRALIAG